MHTDCSSANNPSLLASMPPINGPTQQPGSEDLPGPGSGLPLKNIFLSSLMKSSTCLGSFCYFELTSLNWVSASCLYEGLRTLTSPRHSSRWNGAISWRGSEACMRSWVAVAITVISPSRRSLRAISFLMLSLSSAKGGFSFYWNPIRFVSSPILCAFLIC